MYLCSKFNAFMKKLARFSGIILILIGVLTLASTRLPALVGSNILLLTGLLLIIAGIVLHIRILKGE